LGKKIKNTDADNFGCVDMKYIGEPWKQMATTQASSSFVKTKRSDFGKAQARDEVSFYKPLARI
jgi:hypothetical protein